MTETDVALAMRDTFIIIAKLCAGPLLAVLAVGILVSLVQAVTQVNEQTLSFVPKLAVLIGILVLGEHFLFASLDAYTVSIYDRIVVSGGN